jgi:2'-5' RNA ligase
MLFELNVHNKKGSMASSGLLNRVFYEYFFLIRPDEKTIQMVLEGKRKINELIGISKENQYSVPHLSLFKLIRYKCSDELIIQKGSTALKNCAGFRMAFDGCDVFVHGNVSRSLVLKITDPQPILNLNKSLLNEFDLQGGRFSPHITIAKSVPLKDFNKLSGSLNQFNYKGEFFCDKVTVLKKVVGEDTQYNKFHELQLN